MATHHSPHIYYGCKRSSNLPESKQPKSLSRQWFVFWKHRHPRTGKWQRVRLYGTINSLPTLPAGIYVVSIRRQLGEAALVKKILIQ